MVAAANSRHGPDQQRRRDERGCGTVQQDRAGGAGSRIPQAASWDGSPRPRATTSRRSIPTSLSLSISRRAGSGSGPVRTLGPDHRHPIPLGRLHEADQDPIEIIWGDNFPTANQSPSTYPDIEIWQGRIIMAQKFVDLVNSMGGNARQIHLPDIGIFGNTHFAMSDLNNVQIATCSRSSCAKTVWIGAEIERFRSML